LLIEILVMLIILAILQLVAMYTVEGRQRLTFMLNKAIREEHERANQLLDSMLPTEVLAELKSGALKDAYSYEDMTLLFSDIVGFTSYASGRPVEQVVMLVTKLFAEFDESTLEFGVYKVHTIGDAYIVVNQPRRRSLDAISDCLRVYRMAERMLDTIVRLRVEVQHDKLDMRIGLHVGKFCAGLIGTKRLRFDIWGPDVLAGNLIESNGVAGHICVSESAKHFLRKACPGQFEFKFQCDIELKNKEMLKAYVCTQNASPLQIGPGAHAIHLDSLSDNFDDEPQDVESCASADTLY
jgi:class 3 adenylate cyclase